MATPVFPSINRQVKCLFRHYNEPALVSRFSRQCNGVPVCDEPLLSPLTSLLPFQIYATDATQAGLATPTAWEIWDITDNQPNDPAGGTLVVDLSADLALLEVIDFSGPTRQYIQYGGGALTTTIPTPTGRVWQSRVTIEAGTVFYSEAFKAICFDYTPLVPTFTYGEWDGLIIAVQNTGTTPASPGTATGQQIIDTFGSGTLYTWDGANWLGTTPTIGMYYHVAAITGPWYLYQAPGFTTVTNGPVVFTNGLPCWTGLMDVGVLWNYTTDPADVRVRVTFDLGNGGLGGPFSLDLDGDNLTLFGGVGEQTYSEEPLEITDTSVFLLQPSGNAAEGCVTSLEVSSRTNPISCYMRLEWWNCGNLGTQYYQQDFRNHYYFDPKAFIVRPTPNITEDQQENVNGASVPDFRRKEVTYNLEIPHAHWFLYDALTEAALHDTIRLRTVGTDTLTEFEVTGQWPTDNSCVLPLNLAFQVEDSVSTSTCCETWDPPCPVSCHTILGFVSNPGAHGWYLVDEAPQVQFLSGGGFGDPEPCTYAEGDGENWYWTGTYWDVTVQMSFQYHDFACGSADVTALIMPRYYGQLEYSTNGTDFVAVPQASFIASEWEQSKPVGVPQSATHIRMRAFVGNNCDIGISDVCPFNCTGLLTQAPMGMQFDGNTVAFSVATSAGLSALSASANDAAWITTTGEFYYYNGSTWTLEPSINYLSGQWCFVDRANGVTIPLDSSLDDGYQVDIVAVSNDPDENALVSLGGTSIGNVAVSNVFTGTLGSPVTSMIVTFTPPSSSVCFRVNVRPRC